LGGQRSAESGEIIVEGEPYDAGREQSQARDVRVLPEEPLRNGCVPPMTVVDNLNLRSFDLDAKKSRRFWLDRAGMAARAKDMIAAYCIRAPSPRHQLACCPAATCSAACWRAYWTATCAR
jgi:general nucleoside transport system ATP-binding protein